MAQIKINSIEQPFNYEETEFNIYLNNIIHEWLKTLTTLAYILIPLFFFLDYFTMPEELLPRFIIYRFLSTVIVIIQYLIIRNTKPGI